MYRARNSLQADTRARRIRRVRPALFLLLTLAIAIPGCRSTLRSVANTDMEGEAAPALTSTEWVLAEGEQAPSAKDWRVLAFFSPW